MGVKVSVYVCSFYYLRADERGGEEGRGGGRKRQSFFCRFSRAEREQARRVVRRYIWSLILRGSLRVRLFVSPRTRRYGPFYLVSCSSALLPLSLPVLPFYHHLSFSSFLALSIRWLASGAGSAGREKSRRRIGSFWSCVFSVCGFTLACAR